MSVEVDQDEDIYELVDEEVEKMKNVCNEFDIHIERGGRLSAFNQSDLNGWIEKGEKLLSKTVKYESKGNRAIYLWLESRLKVSIAMIRRRSRGGGPFYDREVESICFDPGYVTFSPLLCKDVQVLSEQGVLNDERKRGRIHLLPCIVELTQWMKQMILDKIREVLKNIEMRRGGGDNEEVLLMKYIDKIEKYFHKYHYLVDDVEMFQVLKLHRIMIERRLRTSGNLSLEELMIVYQLKKFHSYLFPSDVRYLQKIRDEAFKLARPHAEREAAKKQLEKDKEEAFKKAKTFMETKVMTQREDGGSGAARFMSGEEEIDKMHRINRIKERALMRRRGPYHLSSTSDLALASTPAAALDSMERLSLSSGHSVSLKDLCKKKYDEGYRFVSFQIPMESMEEFISRFCRVPTYYGSIGKPNAGVYFSRIVHFEEEGENDEYVPDWYTWMCFHDEKRKDLYKMNALVFAEFFDEAFLDVNDENIKPFLDDTVGSGMHGYRWDEVGKHYWGVHAEYSSISRKSYAYLAWDVETVVVWNPLGIKRMEYYENNGDYTYSSKSILIS